MTQLWQDPAGSHNSEAVIAKHTGRILTANRIPTATRIPTAKLTQAQGHSGVALLWRETLRRKRETPHTSLGKITVYSMLGWRWAH